MRSIESRDIFERLESRLAALCRRRHCILLGNANTGIYLSLVNVRERSGPGEVILPTITNPSVAQMVLYAGFEPVFADVDLPDCTISVPSVRSLLTERTRAILPIHIFGNPAPIREILEIAREAGVAVIEDAAPALGGVLDGDPIGSFGDFSVLSFGADKILSAGGGGALLTDDDAAERAVRELAAALPPLAFDTRRDLESLSHRNLYHGLVDLLRIQPDAQVGSSFLQLVPRYRELYLRRLARDSALLPIIDAGIDALQENLAHRISTALSYERGLSPLGAAARLSVGWHRSGVVWRYTMLMDDPDHTIAVTKELRRSGVPASNHYWSVAQLMYDRVLPRSHEASRLLLNLFVDEHATPQLVEKGLEIILRSFGAGSRPANSSS